MNNPLFIVTIISLSLIGFILLSVIFLTYQYLKYKVMLKDNQIMQKSSFDIEKQTLSSEEKQSASPALLLDEKKHYCSNHPKLPSIGICSICGEAFCANCLKSHKSLQLCLVHLETFLTSQWEEVTSVLTNPNEPEKGVYLYNFKEKMWNNDKIPTYVQTQYKINIENDCIESCVVLFGQKKRISELRQKLADN